VNPAFVVRFRPAGPWRIGPASGARARVDCVYHSDTLFSALTHAMVALGRREEWLDATARSAGSPPVRFSSLFPSMEELMLVPPPRSHWPPPPSPKVRWKSARFVPLALVRSLVNDQPVDDNGWYIDGPSACLLPSDAGFRSGPFRPAVRSHAGVDRLGGAAVSVHRTGCLEFAPGGGLWGVVSFADQAAETEWSGAVRAALRLLGDMGMGGERSLGWGRSESVTFVDGVVPDMILPAVEAPAAPEQPAAEGEAETPPPPKPVMGWWLLSLFSPAADEVIDWSRGTYSLLSRGGRIESAARSGDEKKVVRMVEEGSVLLADAPLRGAAPDVAPDGFPHPVFRAGFPLALPIPLRPPERALGAL
jgi:CRISPR type III-A-associated RAMP protein Csm4